MNTLPNHVDLIREWGSQLVRTAAQFSWAAHEGQYRKYTDEPYWYHTHSVAVRTSEYLTQHSWWDSKVVAAAYLHDVLEDTEITFGDIARFFDSTVANLVLDMTDVYTKDRFPDLNRVTRKALEVTRWSAIQSDARIIKLADLADNTSSIVEHDPAFAVTYLREKADLLEALNLNWRGRK